MKKPLALFFTDLHIHLHNEEVILDIGDQILEVCEAYVIQTVFCLGDVFESRKAQPLQSLKIWERFLKKITDAGIEFYCFPGNHDKVDYESEDSYLDQYIYWPKFRLIRDYEDLDIAVGIRFHMIPFFQENTVYRNYLNKVDYLNQGQNILLTHVGIDGFLNNKEEVVENYLKSESFKKFTQVYVGHYHNKSSKGNVNYIGSIKQNNFGEDGRKGFTLFYDDCSTELIKSEFKGYEKIIVDLDKLKDGSELKSLVDSYKSELKYSNIRLEFTGSEDRVNSLNTDQLKSLGFDVKKKHKDIEVNIEQAEEGRRIEFDDSSIVQEFKAFCTQEDKEDINKGLEYLLKKLKNGNT